MTQPTSAPTDSIRLLLIREGERMFREGAELEPLSKHEAANALVSDLARHPHAFVLACVLDRQMDADRVWTIPFRIQERLGTFAFVRLAQLSLDDVRNLMTKPENLHRFPDEMSRNLHSAIERIGTVYEGDAARMWQDRPSSAEVVYRFLQFRGVGPKIATMAANLLARYFRVEFSDYYSVDISADVHVKRTFWRLGLVGKDASVEEVVYRARTLNPTFPGLLDTPAWLIGRKWCRPTKLLCEDCLMKSVCPSVTRAVAGSP